ncbi:MAG: FimB/Mfa2 family fimbrial subunit [Muribaculaceae bacterium]|nr:FimB/Mfa2 family fimbrial subunit [Muribaculaceae bacterium]
MKSKISLKYACLALISAASALFTSCDDFIMEKEGDCAVKYRVKFVYDMNLKWADAFSSEVNSVNLYAFDSDGVFYKEFTASGEALANPDFYIELDLPAGDYELVAWCGLVNPGAPEESFTVTTPQAGVTRLDDFICSLNTTAVRSGETGPVSDERLYFLYHGNLAVNLPDTQDGETYYYTMPLVKDTNHIRIILQELASDEDMIPSDYDISIEAANGLMAYNNDLLPSPVITYRPWAQVQDEVGVGRVDVANGEIKYVKGIIADLSVARIMASQTDSFNLVVRKADSQELIASVPIIKYALLAKKYYELAYNHKMTDQELLDREDEYVMTFFLEKGKWIDAYVDILQWRIISEDYEIGDKK